MSSQVDVCNIAAILLGASAINAMSDTTPQAIAFNSIWNTVRQSELRKHVWKFSKARAQLPAMTTPPVNGPYSTQYALPGDWLRTLQVGDANFSFPGVDLSDYRSGPTQDDYLLEGNAILSNLGAPLSLLYVRDVTDTTQWDACFSDAMGARLAYTACFRVTNSDELQKGIAAAYTQAIRDAIRANAFETPPLMQADDTWISTRPVGSGGAPTIRYG